MFIRCPNCGKETSNSSKICINCSSPILITTGNTNISTQKFGSRYKVRLMHINSSDVQTEQAVSAYIRDIKQTNRNGIIAKGLTQDQASIVANNITMMGGQTEILTDNNFTDQDVGTAMFIFDYERDKGKPHCPKCGSTSITTGTRGVNWKLGLIGASKTVNRCTNCGHTWTPRL